MPEEVQHILSIFAEFKYGALIPVAIIEGPIVSVIAGFLSSIGKLAVLPSIIILYFGDIISDIFFFSLGHGGKKLVLKVKTFESTPERLERIDAQFRYKPWKTMIIGKVVYGLGMTFMAAAGASRMTLFDFIKYISLLNALRTTILFTVGYYFGKAIFHFGPQYYPAYIAGLLGFISLWLYLSLRMKKTAEELENAKNGLK